MGHMEYRVRGVRVWATWGIAIPHAHASTPRVSSRAWPTGKRGSLRRLLNSANQMTTWEARSTAESASEASTDLELEM